MERAWAELKMGASGEPVFGFAASSTLPFIAHGGLVEQASVATIIKAAMQRTARSHVTIADPMQSDSSPQSAPPTWLSD